MKLLTSNWVGQDFWHGASAHFKQRLASLRAPRSDKVVCFMSEKSFFSGVHDCGCGIGGFKVKLNRKDDSKNLPDTICQHSVSSASYSLW